MSNSLKQFVSDVRNAFKLVADDDVISDRYIASELIKTNLKLVNQSLNKRVGWNSPNLFTTLPCIPMIEVPLVECCDVSSECTVSRSKDRLPAIADSKYSLVIQGVWSVDKRSKFKETTANRYSNYLNIALKNKNEKFFWVLDNYLYTSEPMIEMVSMSAFFPNPIDIRLYSCTNEDTSCPVNPMDLEFKTLPFLKDDIVTITYQKMLQTFKQSVPDQSPDGESEYK